MKRFDEKVKSLFDEHEALLTRKNEPAGGGNGANGAARECDGAE